MAKIIDYDFRKGSIVNKGTLAVTEVLTGATLQKSEKGISFVSTQAGSNTLQINTTLNSTYSVEFAVRVDSVASLSGYLFDARYNSGTGYLYTSTYAALSVSAGTVYRDGVARNTLPPLNTWMHVVVSGIPITCTRLMFNSNSSAGQGCIGKYAFFRVYEGTLTAQEVAKLYADYKNAPLLGKPKRGFLVNKPNDLSSQKGTGPTQGLVAAYNMKPNGLTLTDISGNGYNGTITQGVTTTQNGIMIRQGQAITTTSMPLENDFSIAFRVKWLTNGSTSNFLRQNGSGTSNIWIYRNSLGAVVLDQNAGGSNGTPNGSAGPIGSEQTWVLTFNDATNTVTWYRDGVSLGTGAGTYNPSGSRTAPVLIGNLSATEANYTLKDELQDLRFYNRILTAQEIKDYNNQFAKQPYLVEDFSDLPADGNAVVPRDWTKVSGTFKGGEINLTQGNLIPNGYFESGITGYTITNGAGGNAVLSHETSIPISGVGSLRVTQTTSSALTYRPNINIALTKTTEVDKTYSIRFKSRLLSGAVRFSPGDGLHLGLNTSQSYFLGSVFSGSQQWSVMAKSTVTGSTLYLYLDGSSSAFDLLLDDIEVVEIDPLPTLTKGSKYLECVTAGIIAIPSNQLAGTWEWDWYKGADANTSKFNFVAPNFAGDGLSSMTFYVDNSENLLLRVNNSTIASTATSYFQNFTWYRVRVTRTTAGFWTMLIKGGAFTPTAGYDGWTLISTTGGIGTNPIINTAISSSIYLLFDIDAGDRFTNLKLTNGVII